jgi:pimeloyl-ACP methyl ester carboxylesterase
MGGTVSLSVALQYPHRVRKVVVIGSPIVGSSLALPLKLAGYRFIAFMLFNMMWAFRSTMRIVSPFICADPRFPDMMDKDLSKTTLESFLRSIASLRRTDLRPMLSQIKIPVMGMYGDRDNIVHPRQWQPLLQSLPNAKIVRWERAQHFVMLDTPQEFMETLKLFLDEEVNPT